MRGLLDGPAERRLLDGATEHNLGRRVPLKPAEREMLIELAGSRMLAEVVTLALSARVVTDVPADAGVEAVARAQAEIEIGSGGFRTVALIDVGHGALVTLPTASLRCTLINTGSVAIDAGAFVTYGATSPRAQLSLYGPRLFAGDEWIASVPPFATGVEVLGAAESPKQVDIGYGRVPRWIYGERVTPGARMRPLPIANGCDFVRVTHPHPSSGDFEPVAIFTLAL